MNATLCTLTLAALLAADPDAGKDAPRKPNPFAPSLPLLTDEEEAKLDKLIEQWIKYDSGTLLLPAAEAKKLRKDFESLGPEATFALIRGINRAAEIEHSCPAVTIAKKLNSILSASNDAELLDFARDNIGAGITRSRHLGVLKELKVGAMLRMNAVARAQPPKTPAGGGPKTPRTMTDAELAKVAGSERGERLKQVLTELGGRKSDDAIAALAAAAATYEKDVQALAREQLANSAAKLPAPAFKEKFKDDRAEVRAAVARVATRVNGGDLINLLEDENGTVREAAHEALVRLNRGRDLGPSRGASENDRAAAVQRWREWWTAQGGR